MRERLERLVEGVVVEVEALVDAAEELAVQSEEHVGAVVVAKVVAHVGADVDVVVGAGAG